MENQVELFEAFSVEEICVETRAYISEDQPCWWCYYWTKA